MQFHLINSAKRKVFRGIIGYLVKSEKRLATGFLGSDHDEWEWRYTGGGGEVVRLST
jgi:hypothetical protein